MEYFELAVMLLPLYLALALCLSKRVRTTAVRHPLSATLLLTTLSVLPRCMYGPQLVTEANFVRFGDVPGTWMFAIDAPLCAPLKAGWTLAIGSLHSLPMSVWLAYTFLAFFALFRVAIALVGARATAPKVTPA